MNRELIFDVGMHRGEDTAYYLNKGYDVIAVDADYSLITHAREKFADAIQQGRLTLIHCAVAAEDGEIAFYRSENTLWNSLKLTISNRSNLFEQEIRVPARRLSTLLGEYGIPIYCKIDVEGYDAICLTTMQGLPKLPKYISVETECVGEGEELTSSEALETLHALHRIGYRQFKLVDQEKLAVLKPNAQFYRPIPTWKKVARKAGFCRRADSRREQLCVQHHYQFPMGASGPFGGDLDGQWLDYSTAQNTLLSHRNDYFRMAGSVSFGFWCDWHATY